MCEELILGGQYGLDGTALDRMITDFPNTLENILVWVLNRLEQDMNNHCHEISLLSPTKLQLKWLNDHRASDVSTGLLETWLRREGSAKVDSSLVGIWKFIARYTLDSPVSIHSSLSPAKGFSKRRKSIKVFSPGVNPSNKSKIFS